MSAGRVQVRGIPARKPATAVDADTPVRVLDTDDPGLRLARRVQARRRARGVPAGHGRGPAVPGRRRVDRWLHRCAAPRAAPREVVAVDVGYGQLAWPLRHDERVRVLDRTNVRDADPGADRRPGASSPSPTCRSSRCGWCCRRWSPAPPTTATCCRWSSRSSRSAGSGSAPVAWSAIRRCARTRCASVAAAAARLGWSMRGVTSSRLPGPSGNVEFFLWLRRATGPVDEARDRAAIEQAAAASAGRREGPAGGDASLVRRARKDGTWVGRR